MPCTVTPRASRLVLRMRGVSTSMMWSDGGWGSGDWLAMVLTMLVLWGGAVAVIVWAVRAWTNPRSRDGEPKQPDSPDDILARRFALGDIDDAEFRDRLEQLRKART